jgi:hypothetical protein
MKYSLVIAGIATTVIGTFLVNTLGISDLCSNELTSKVVEFAPLAIGSVMSYIGRVRQGDVTLGGFKKV